MLLMLSGRIGVFSCLWEQIYHAVRPLSINISRRKHRGVRGGRGAPAPHPPEFLQAMADRHPPRSFVSPDCATDKGRGEPRASRPQ